MKIGIIGAGSIGATLTRKLSSAGHEVKVANSRGPETISPELLVVGATAVTASEVVTDIDALIISVPLSSIPALKPLVANLPTDATILDTSNYYPMRDGQVPALDQGQVESVWVTEQLGRPVAKAWNAILAGSFETKGQAAGDPGRLAIPVAADRETDKTVAMSLVEDTGFDAVDSGSLADSWRQQPGAPTYCTDLTRQEIPEALASAKKERIPQRRDLAMTMVMEKIEGGVALVNDDMVELNRSTYN
ncbi:NADPH-dependent F420 reductase [Paeniglutamicibacter sp. Y32M11]|uniref:NADPH-dependent F420 reductase n=1 Tax=Paeniglutamicibacter sp. Y32M11 TaxID=2853258 RepID=UPI001C52DA3A|nr:NAD(P)-binding domain-containing protein [Paeniglutamicibacter sp. Y32M11]QXQ10094.1 NAD(P)-binding domain-containing protein [Paeniglutamicibacter sp. Y32M11]